MARDLLARLDRAATGPLLHPVAPSPLAWARYEARLACVRGDLAGEIARYREVIADDPEQPSWVFENLSGALLQGGQMEEGLRMLDEALVRDPWPLSIALRSADGWIARGLESYLQQALASASRLVVDHPSVLLQHGTLAMKAGLLAEAEELFRRGIAMGPRHLRLREGLGQVLRRQGRFGEAAEVYAEANADDNPALVIAAATAFLDAGAAATALDVLDRAPWLAATPPSLLIRGRALDALDRVAEAVEVLTQAVELQPFSARPAHHLGLALERLGRSDEARDWAQRAAACPDAWPALKASVSPAPTSSDPHG